MSNIMLDLETMGNSSDSAITAIGAVKFDEERGVYDKFYRVVDLQSSVDAGGSIDPSTVIWWMGQSDDARKQFQCTGEDIEIVLKEFEQWCSDVEYKVWGNGVAFDNVILGNAYKRLGREVPWAFWNDFCYRTVKNLNRHIRMKRVGTHHNAVDDAESQALHLIEILKSK